MPGAEAACGGQQDISSDSVVSFYGEPGPLLLVKDQVPLMVVTSMSRFCISPSLVVAVWALSRLISCEIIDVCCAIHMY